jgi:3-oxoacyl-[acyl-carrier protein] reductase
MDLGLKGRVALVTGASMGIGEAAAIELAGEGCDLAICARHADQLVKVRDQIVAKGARCVVVPCDIRQPGEITAMMNEVGRAYGRLDILVNNAGAATHGTFASLNDEQLLADYELKVLGQLRCTRAALPMLEKSPAPRVINVNAIAGRVVIPGLFATATHRASCYALSKALA